MSCCYFHVWPSLTCTDLYTPPLWLVSGSSSHLGSFWKTCAFLKEALCRIFFEHSVFRLTHQGSDFPPALLRALPNLVWGISDSPTLACLFDGTHHFLPTPWLFIFCLRLSGGVLWRVFFFIIAWLRVWGLILGQVFKIQPSLLQPSPYRWRLPQSLFPF